MKEMAANSDDDFERFRTGAAKYAAYLETPEGRLRLDLAFANLQDFLPQASRFLHALDLGDRRHRGPPGATWSSRHVAGCVFTHAGFRKACSAGSRSYGEDCAETRRCYQFAGLFHAELFNVIICHSILEYVDDPRAFLRSAARALRDSSSIISAAVRNQAGEVLKAAIQDGDLAATERNLTAEWGHESLYGGRVRLFTPESLRAMLLESSLSVTAERGVRVLADYLLLQVLQH